MTEAVSPFPRRRLTVAGIAAAFVLTVFSTMMHGSHMDARLQGPSPWTVWVTLDLLLLVLPGLVPAVAFVSLVAAGEDRRSSGAIALAIWLTVAFGSNALAVILI